MKSSKKIIEEMQEEKQQVNPNPQKQQKTQEEQPSTVIVYLNIQYQTERVVSAAIYTNTKRKFEVCTFLDNEHYVSLQSFLIQCNPKEASSIFKIYFTAPAISSQRKKILDKFDQLDAKLTDQKLPNIQLQKVLAFLLKREVNLYQKELQNHKNKIVLTYLLNTLKLQSQLTNKNQFELCLFENNSFMKLDKACIIALSIFPKDIQNKVLSTNSTLFDVLNKCKTAFGTRCLKRWMKQPLQDAQQLKLRVQKLQYFVKNSNVKNIFQYQLKRMPDLDKIYYVFYKVQSGKKVKCQISDLIKIYRVIEGLSNLVSALQKVDLSSQFMQQIYDGIAQNVNTIKTLCQMIDKCIDMDAPRQSQYFVKPQSQPSLTAISKQMNSLKRGINQQKQEVQKQLKTQIQISDSATYKYVFMASKKGFVQKVKENKSYKFLTAKQTKITFTTQKLIKLCNQLVTVQNQYKEEQQEILTKMFKIVAGYYPIMENLSLILSQLDVLTSWATFIGISNQTWCKPSFGQHLKGNQMRHPCVKKCIANDIQMENSKTIILTGPNMGGKSTYIRTVGICTYLAHIGCFVPATSFQCPIIDTIICRVGASDMQIKGISTFMSQMIETNCMLKTATNKSLVLIDQLGRGTSTNQGFGISWGICEYLHKQINPYCLFATHFHEMISIADEIQGIINMYTSCRIQNSKIQFEYRVFRGKMQKSYGIQVAKMLQFPQSIIQNAQNYLQIYEKSNDWKCFQDIGLNEQKVRFLSRLVQQMQNQMMKAEADDDQKKENIKNQYQKKIGQIVQNAYA